MDAETYARFDLEGVRMRVVQLPRSEEVPADGQFKPSTGNQYVDKAIDGVSGFAQTAGSVMSDLFG